MKAITNGVSDSIRIFVATLIGIALYNVVELHISIFFTFKRRSGIYFWTLLVATWGVSLSGSGFLLNAFDPSKRYARMVLNIVGWIFMVSGQSMVLYSRLHLVVQSRARLRLVLAMIIFDAIVGHLPIVVMVSALYITDDGKFMIPYSGFEKFQITLFFLQECILSGIYIWETVRFLRATPRGVPLERKQSKSIRSIIQHLLYVNVAVVVLNITILALEFTGYHDVQTSYKIMAYSAKLKLEFSILDRLVALAKHRTGESSPGSLPPGQAYNEALSFTSADGPVLTQTDPATTAKTTATAAEISETRHSPRFSLPAA
jgi:hypothetical protein